MAPTNNKGVNSSSPTTAIVLGGVYNATPPVLVDGQAAAVQLNSDGSLKTSGGGGGGGAADITGINGVAPALSNPLPVELSDGTQSFGTAGNPLSVDVVGGSIVAANASVGADNATAPTSATEIGTIDAGGKLQGVSAANPLPISGSISATNPSVGPDNATAPTSDTLIGTVDAGGKVQAVSAANPLPISGSISASNPSVGTDNVTAPTSATEIGTIDGSGKLQGASVTNPVPVALPAGTVTTLTPPTAAAIGAACPVPPTASDIATAIVSNPPTVGIAAAQKIEVYDGTNTATVKAASTASADTDTSLVVQLSPKQPNLDTALNVHDASPSAVSIASAQKIEVYDGTNTAAVKAASTAAADTDTSLVVQLNPKQPNLDVALNVHDASPTAVSIASAQKIEVYDGTNTATVKAASSQSATTDTSLVVQINPEQPNLTTALNVHDASPAAISIASAQKVEVYDGTNTAAVKAASTAAADTDTSLVVQLNPKQPNLDTALNVSLPSATVSTLTPPTAAAIGSAVAAPTAAAIGSAVAAPTAAAIASAIVSNPPTVSIASAQKIEVYDGTNTAAVKAASTAAADGDTSLVVQLNPKQPNLDTALNVHDSSPASQAVTNAGTFAVQNVPTDGTHAISAAMSAIGVAPTGTYLETTNTIPTAVTAGGATLFTTQGLTTKINLVAAPAKLLSYSFTNPNAAMTYFSLYNTATTPAAVNTTGATLLWEIGVPANGAANFNFGDIGAAFSAGIAVSVQTTEAGGAAPGTGCTVSIQYK